MQGGGRFLEWNFYVLIDNSYELFVKLIYGVIYRKIGA